MHGRPGCETRQGHERCKKVIERRIEDEYRLAKPEAVEESPAGVKPAVADAIREFPGPVVVQVKVEIRIAVMGSVMRKMQHERQREKYAECRKRLPQAQPGSDSRPHHDASPEC
jgi:hypothetical protein